MNFHNFVIILMITFLTFANLPPGIASVPEHFSVHCLSCSQCNCDTFMSHCVSCYFPVTVCHVTFLSLCHVTFLSQCVILLSCHSVMLLSCHCVSCHFTVTVCHVTSLSLCVMSLHCHCVSCHCHDTLSLSLYCCG